MLVLVRMTKGRSSLILAAGALAGNKQKIYCVDTWKNCDLRPYFDFFPEWKKNITAADLNQHCVPFIKDTVAAAREFDSSSFGLVFVDAWHTRIAVENDFRAWWNRLISEKGKMIFHDVIPAWPEIVEFIEWLEKEPNFGKVERMAGMAILTRTKEQE